jgi:hypothetical protein
VTDLGALRLGFRAVLLAAAPGFAAAVTAGRVFPENRDGLPEVLAGNVYYRETALLSSESRVSFGLVAAFGRYTVEVLVRRGSGTEIGEALALELLDALPANHHVPFGGGNYAEIIRAERLSGFAVTDVWYSFGAQFLWSAHSAL